LSAALISVTTPILTVRGATKRYGVTVALDDATIDLFPGEVHVLLGENGAGKSTLGKVVAGRVAPDGGEFIVGGMPRKEHTIEAARAAGIELVLQELSLIPQLTVAENLFLGRESERLVARRRQERKATRELLAQFAIDRSPDDLVAELHLPERQLLEIAKAARTRPRIIVMDEPSSRLTAKEKASLYKTIEMLKGAGTAILYITHHLNEVLEIGDRVSAMRNGRITDSILVHGDLTEDMLIRLLTGRIMSEPVRRMPHTPSTILFEARDVTVSEACRNVSLYVEAGEIVGLYGVVGCGREHFGQALVGIKPVTSGTITFAGKRYSPHAPSDAARLGVAYLSGDRKEAGILAQRSLIENLGLGALQRRGMFGILNPREESRNSNERLRQLKVRFSSADQPISSLSGGNQQKILFGRVIDSAPRFIVMEDPMVGVDVGAKAELHALTQDIARRSVSILLMSSDIKETISICHRVYTMFDGRIVGEYSLPSHQDEDRILADVVGRR
jgi:ribose transport system ATP-binding protein